MTSMPAYIVVHSVDPATASFACSQILILHYICLYTIIQSRYYNNTYGVAWIATWRSGQEDRGRVRGEWSLEFGVWSLELGALGASGALGGDTK